MDDSRRNGALMLGALGVVYGDIGTSPLYAFREAMAAAGTGSASVIGLLSLLFWSLTIIVTLKYVLVMLRADNAGEGGILSLVALAQARMRAGSRWTPRIVLIGVLGTAMFYCDAALTPAVSVLSAVEGLQDIDAAFARVVLPVTLAILVILFSFQRYGTASVARLFGPVMIVWFGMLAVTGLLQIISHPAVLAALNPWPGLQLLINAPGTSLAVLGAVFLAVTGAEALYADMGHFGRLPVQRAWLYVVWPSLLLNYFGQGALVLKNPAAAASPFFALTPGALLPLAIGLATAATIIASQATISGAYSVTRQAVQLDLLPRMRIVQTSDREHGQIYVPATNLVLLLVAIAFVLAFGSSSALTAAYGAAVVGTMFITSLLGAVVARQVWNWSWLRTVGVFGSFAWVEAAFVLGNATKIPHGGWVPLALSLCLYVVFLTWRAGRAQLRAVLQSKAVPIARLSAWLEDVVRVPGTAVFLVSDLRYVPTALLRNIDFNHVAHEKMVVLQLVIERRPRVDELARSTVTEVQEGVYLVESRFGFMETPDVNAALRSAARHGRLGSLREISFFIGQHLVRALPRSGWSAPALRVFAWMQRRSTQAAEFFHMPTQRVVILATEVELR